MCAQSWGKAVLMVILFGLLALVVKTVHESPDILSLLRPELARQVPDPSVNGLRLVDSQIDFRQPGHIVQARFTVSNQGREDLKNIDFVCSMHDPAGNDLGLARWIGFETIGAGSERTYAFVEKRLGMHEAAEKRIGCRIAGAEKAGRPFELMREHGGRQAVGHAEGNDQDAGKAAH